MKTIDANKININGVLKTLPFVYKKLSKDKLTKIQALCPEHEKACSLRYDDDGIKIEDCVDCGPEGSLIIIEKDSEDERKKSMRRLGIDAIEPYVINKKIKSPLTKGKIFFIESENGITYPVQITGKYEKKTIEVVRISDNQLKIEIQGWLASTAFTPSDIDSIIDYFEHNKNNIFDYKVSYISEPSDKLNLTYKIIPKVNADSSSINLCPNTKNFLDRISDGEAFAAFIWSVFETKHIGRQMLYLQGPRGEEGKSILSKALRRAIGEQYVSSMRPSDFSTSSNFGVAKAEGKRLLLIPDVNNDKLLKYDCLKQILGGDPISVENKYEKALTMVINCRVLASSNFDLNLSGENYETSRLIWLTIDPMKEHIPDLENKLIAEFPKFLEYCKYCYDKKCKNDYYIDSEASKQKINDVVEGRNDDVLEQYYNYFEYDESYYIERQDFIKVLRIAKQNISNKEVDDVKRAFAVKGFTDFLSSTGYRIKKNDKRIPIYRGLKYKNI